MPEEPDATEFDFQNIKLLNTNGPGGRYATSCEQFKFAPGEYVQTIKFFYKTGLGIKGMVF